MKKHLLLAAIAALSVSAGVRAANYAGNGATGFGGEIGPGSIDVTDGGSTINITVNSPTGFNGNALAIYLDTINGGYTSTSSFTDHADGGRQTLSGVSGSGQTVVNFATGFTADYGISLEPGNFAGIFQLSTGSFAYAGSANLDTSATKTLSLTINKSDIGLPASGGSFSFVASLLSGTGYRANETVGTSVTTVDPTNTGTAPNAGFTGSQTFTTFDTVALPEPASLGMLGLGAVTLLRRRK